MIVALPPFPAYLVFDDRSWCWLQSAAADEFDRLLNSLPPVTTRTLSATTPTPTPAPEPAPVAKPAAAAASTTAAGSSTAALDELKASILGGSPSDGASSDGPVRRPSLGPMDES